MAGMLDEREPYDRVVAVFMPARLDDLRPGAEAWVGREAEWVALWRISVEDGGSYVGQLAWGLADYVDAPFAWVPSCDLVEVDDS